MLADSAVQHFDRNLAGAWKTFIDFNEDEFALKIQKAYNEDPRTKLLDGPSSSIKYLIMPNFSNALSSVLKIDETNRAELKSGYRVQPVGELNVLCRWFEKPAPRADFLEITVHSAGQFSPLSEDGDFGIVSINAHSVD